MNRIVSPWPKLKILLTTSLFIIFLTCLNWILNPIVHYRAIGMIYVMGITTGSLYLKNYNIILSSILGAIAWNLLFIPPKFTFAINSQEDWMLLVLYLVAAVVIGIFMKRLKENENSLKQERDRVNEMYQISKDITNAKDVDNLLAIVQEKISSTLFCQAIILLGQSPGEEILPVSISKNTDYFSGHEVEALQFAIGHRTTTGRFTEHFPTTCFQFIPLIRNDLAIGIVALNIGKIQKLSNNQQRILNTIVIQLSSVLEREYLHRELRKTLVTEESQRLYKTLLNSVSHELRTPLAAIKGFSAALKQSEISKDIKTITGISDEISFAVDRLNLVVQSLLDMSRLESGHLKLNLDYTDIRELVDAAVKKVKQNYGEREITFNYSPDLPLIFIDYFLIEQTVENIVRNAFIYTPPNSPIDIDVTCEANHLDIAITDYGTGIGQKESLLIFDKFFKINPNKTGGLGLGLAICRAVVDLHKGLLQVKNIKNKGASFIISLPRELDREY